MTLYERLKEKDACYDAIVWLEDGRTKKTAKEIWNECDNFMWLIWWSHMFCEEDGYKPKWQVIKTSLEILDTIYGNKKTGVPYELRQYIDDWVKLEQQNFNQFEMRPYYRKLTEWLGTNDNPYGERLRLIGQCLRGGNFTPSYIFHGISEYERRKDSYLTKVCEELKPDFLIVNY